MLYHVAVLWEILSIVVCIHSIYNRKIKLNIETVVLFVAILAILELVIAMNLNNITTLFTFVIIVSYCIYSFNDNFMVSK